VSMLDDVPDIAIETDCMELYIKKGISMASFYYAVCLNTGRGVCIDDKRAKAFFSRVCDDVTSKRFTLDLHVSLFHQYINAL